MRVRLTEAQFQRQIEELAAWAGWLTWHDQDSRRNLAGWPDLALAKPGCPLILAELKSERGRLRPQQQVWLDTLRQATGLRVELWRPDDWAAVVRLLEGEA